LEKGLLKTMRAAMKAGTGTPSVFAKRLKRYILNMESRFSSILVLRLRDVSIAVKSSVLIYRAARIIGIWSLILVKVVK
jgi:hypothetical protein